MDGPLRGPSRIASVGALDGVHRRDRNISVRRLVVSMFASLDGIMQAPGGPEEDPTGGFTLGG